jgi:hypothetical protein
MKRICISAVIFAFTSGLVAINTSSASAVPCWEATKAGDGLYKEAHCKTGGPPFNFVPGTIVANLGAGLACVKMRTPGTGVYEDAKCATRNEGGNYNLVNVQEICIKVKKGAGDWDTNACNTNNLNKKEYVLAIATVEAEVNGKGRPCLAIVEAGTGEYKTEEGCAKETESEEAGGNFVVQEEETPEWLVDGISLSGTLKVDSEGKVVLTDLNAKVKLECEGTDKGTVSAGQEAEETTVTVAGCKVLEGSCPSPSAKATKLPWKLALTGTGPTKLDFEGESGYEVVCAGIVHDTCVASAHIPVLDLESGSDPLNFEFPVKENENDATCSLNKKREGDIAGNVFVLAEEGEELLEVS